MTASQVSVIVDKWEAGPLMDAAVGEACGFTSSFACGVVNGVCLRGTEEFPEMVEFRPSVDWNDAMFAAERFGLFKSPDESNRISMTLGHDGQQWSVQECYEPPLSFIGIKAPTGPLVICRAILKLSSAEWVR